jgi:hypothetical protein
MPELDLKHLLPVQGDEQDMVDDRHLAHKDDIVEMPVVLIDTRNNPFIMVRQCLDDYPESG